MIDDDAKKNNIEFVKINDKRYGKSLGVKKFPALTFFRGRDIMIYDGDLKDEEAVLDFLTDEDNMAIPDKIEDVDAEQLISIVETDPFVTVIFYDESKASSKALEHVEEIDEEIRDSVVNVADDLQCSAKEVKIDQSSDGVSYRVVNKFDKVLTKCKTYERLSTTKTGITFTNSTLRFESLKYKFFS